MVMKKYQKDPLEELSDEQLEELLNVTHQEMPEDSLNKIKNRVHQTIQQAEKTVPMRKKAKKKWTKIVAAAAILTLMVGFTMKDNLKEAYYRSFGTESQKLLLNADKLSEVAEDEGLKLTAKSSFKDGDTTYVFMDLQDLTGDRLSQDTIIDKWEMLNGGNARVVSYDDKSKTASILVSSISWESHKDQGFELSRLTSGLEEKTERVSPPWQELIQEGTNWIKTPLKDGGGGGADPEELDKLGLDFDDLSSEYMEPNILNYSLNQDDSIILENATFKDGLLHLLVKYPNDLYHNGLNLTLVSKTDNAKEAGYVVSYSAGNGTHSNVTGRKDYDQVVFNVTPSELENYDLRIEDYQTKDIITGDWAVKLTQPTELEKKELGAVTLSNDEGILENIELSGLSLRFTYEATKKEEPLNIKLKLTSGQELDVSSHDNVINIYSGEREEVSVQYDYIPLEEISEILVNGTVISVT